MFFIYFCYCIVIGDYCQFYICCYGGDDWFNGVVGCFYFNYNDDLCVCYVNWCSDGGNSDF